jgi:hypothetical protein
MFPPVRGLGRSIVFNTDNCIMVFAEVKNLMKKLLEKSKNELSVVFFRYSPKNWASVGFNLPDLLL